MQSPQSGGTPVTPRQTDSAAVVVTTSNDRVIACATCKAAADVRRSRLYYTGSDDARKLTFDVSSSITINGDFLDTEILRLDVAHVMNVLDDNIDKYKTWLNDKQILFEQYFTEYDASEEMFNKLNLIVSQIKQGQKMLTAWYMTVQDVVADIWDGISTYEAAKNLILSYRLQDDQSYSIGLPINTVTLAKKNRTKAKSLNKHRTKALNAETAIRQALFRLQSELTAFNQGLIRTRNNRFINLVELGEAIDSLFERDSPLVRVQQQLANLINTSDLKIKVHHGQMPGINEITERGSFVKSLKPAELPTEYELINHLMQLAFNSLYTENTKRAIEKSIDFAEAHVKTADNVNRLEELKKKLRGAEPLKVLDDLRLRMRERTEVFENMAFVKRLMNAMHKRDIPIWRPRFDEIMKELHETARLLSESRAADDGDRSADAAEGTSNDSNDGMETTVP